ncbi:MAG TPA: zinc-ribbon domain-containing protein [Verrucomicrobiae bacterium]|nr:zinc-ribbon domain-containing protein [Verrucomicrobiae bacterium]
MTPETCPCCGAEVPPNAKACPECGADENTGWSEETHTAGLDLPDEDFNYEEFVKREFGGGKNPRPPGIHWFWWVVGILVLAALVWGLLRH